jgi:hypothetical protein
MDNQSISIATVITGIKDGAYQQAKIRGVTRSIVESLMAYIPNLGDPAVADPFSDVVRDELREGYMQRWAETNKSRLFVAVDGNWVEKSEKEGMALKAEKFELNVYSAFSYTQQAFGALKSEQPGKHQLIGEERTKFNKYVSNCLGDLKREATRIYKEKNGIVASRASIAFFDWLLTGDKSVIANIRQRAINAKSKKEISDSDFANIDKAIAAFKGKLK